eukprot:CAMPEP_0116879932 /NCGR_PEP_ID=MMETSP0463-20121206/11790_1 /TAXON_ID=181622 /ORGANISM="Strombidinopsis sp, Strain SopsisLIS2011" /LENGTH=137 /DNA_ID=CAMNT_0004529863 /DNA_START=490 /DNA_END=903 /DNA_ORIENTATION=-
MRIERDSIKQALQIERQYGSHFDNVAAFWQENDVCVGNKSVTKSTTKFDTSSIKETEEELELLKDAQQPKLSMMSTKSSSVEDKRDHSDRCSEPPREEDKSIPMPIEINPFSGNFTEGGDCVEAREQGATAALQSLA